MSERYQSPLRRARGLGSAHSGVGHWWWQRLTAALLVPLSGWLVISIARLAGAPHAVAADWLTAPWNGVAVVVVLVAVSGHLALGLQVIVEDYVHYRPLAILLRGLVTTLAFTLPAIAAYAVLHIALTDP